MPNGKKGGIVRAVDINCISLTQYKDDERHGLRICWLDIGFIIVSLFKKDSKLGLIMWNSHDW